MSRPQRDKEGEAFATQPHPVSTRGSKVPSERVALLVVTALLAATVIVICRLSLALVRTNERFQTLSDKFDAVKRNVTAFTGRKCEDKPCIPQPLPTCPGNGRCLKCEEGWEQLGEKCYYFSTTKSTWSNSRAECRRGGGDLVKIDSREEQAFFDQRLREKMTDDEDKFWIGLTDTVNEGTWLWTDRSPLNSSLVFWSGKEPDNWTGDNSEGEDCVRMGQKGGAVDLKSWFDRSCLIPHKYICEKPAAPGQMKCT
ncbi:galactose-specific lectin nattectin-like [Tautogolabrus adspersus]